MAGADADLLHTPANALSGGQQRRRCIARALSARPESVLMDEPTPALDSLRMMKVDHLIGDLKQTVTIVPVTRKLQQAARGANCVAFFSLGEMVEAGSAGRMFTAAETPHTQNYIACRFG